MTSYIIYEKLRLAMLFHRAVRFERESYTNDPLYPMGLDSTCRDLWIYHSFLFFLRSRNHRLALAIQGAEDVRKRRSCKRTEGALLYYP